MKTLIKTFYLALLTAALITSGFLGCASKGIQSHTDNDVYDSVDTIPKSHLPKPDEPPTIVYQEIPEYPRKAREALLNGYVVLRVYVSADGTVKYAEAIDCEPTGYGFEETAVNAAYKCRYNPATKDGQPIDA